MKIRFYTEKDGQEELSSALQGVFDNYEDSNKIGSVSLATATGQSTAAVLLGAIIIELIKAQVHLHAANIIVELAEKIAEFLKQKGKRVKISKNGTVIDITGYSAEDIETIISAICQDE